MEGLGERRLRMIRLLWSGGGGGGVGDLYPE